MKWIPLDGKKHPPFSEKLLVIDKSGSWKEAWLSEKKETQTGLKYIFSAEEIDDITDATHYLMIEPPKPKE